MADEKKPKIDLKARLGKTAVGGATPPPPGVGVNVPMPGAPVATPASGGDGAPAAVPAPAAARAAVPVPPGAPIGPPPGFKAPSGVTLDPSNPLAAAIGQAAPARSVAPPAPQRIEVDEVTVQEARKGARKQGIIMGALFGVVLGVVGFGAGSARETSKGREAAVGHAKELANDVTKSRDQLKALGDKLEAGRNSLAKDKKFPDSLAKDLSAINVDFDGGKLAGVRFSGWTTDATHNLIEYISAVQATNDRKSAVSNLLTKLQKPLTEQFAAAASGKPPNINFVVLINKDSKKDPFGVLAPLQKPIDPSSIPAEFTATDPLTHANVTAPKFQSLDKPGAAPVIPKSIEAACPSETSGQIAQLVGQLSRLITDIRGEGQAGPDEIAEPKPGLLQRADTLVTQLNKIQ
jgi:hypothetical protein